MNKTTSIHLQAVPIVIEEKALAILEAYLSDIKKQLVQSVDRDEVMNDIELNLIEKWDVVLHSAQSVVTVKNVETAIAQLGQAKEFVDETGYQTASFKSPLLKREIFRDVDHAMLCGVASGLAAYFQVNVIWIRSLFILFTFFVGAGPVLYVIFWLMIPIALTPAQKAAMQGKELTVATLQDLQDAEKVSESAFLRMRRMCVRAISFVRRYVRIVFSACCIIVGVIGLFALILLVLGYIFNYQALEVFVPISSLWSLAERRWMIGLCAVVIAIPFFLLSIFGTSWLRKKRIIANWSIVVLCVVWGISTALGIALGVRMFREAQLYYEAQNPHITSSEYGISAFTDLVVEGFVSVDVVHGDAYTVSISGRSQSVRSVGVRQKDDVLTIHADQERFPSGYDWCVWCAFDPTIITVTVPVLNHVTSTDYASLRLSEFVLPTLVIETHEFSHIDVLDTQLEQGIILQTERSSIYLTGSGKEMRLDLSDEAQLYGSLFQLDSADVHLTDESFASLSAETIGGVVQDESTLEYQGSPVLHFERLDSAMVFPHIDRY